MILKSSPKPQSPGEDRPTLGVLCPLFGAIRKLCSPSGGRIETGLLHLSRARTVSFSFVIPWSSLVLVTVLKILKKKVAGFF